MEEVDEIVVHTLRQIGCELEDISSLKGFTTEIVIEGVVRCLKLIKPELELSHHVPPSMSARYRLSSSLAAELTQLGYKGEIGYQTFLYSNDSDVRRIFLFLFEKLPKESEKVLEKPLGKLELLQRDSSLYFKDCLNTPWLPYYCRTPIGIGPKYLKKNSLFSCVPYQARVLCMPRTEKTWSSSQRKKYFSYYGEYVSSLPKQANTTKTLICSILEDNIRHFANETKNEWGQENMLTNESVQGVDVEKKKALEMLKQALNEKGLHRLESPIDILKSSLITLEDTKGSRFAHIVEFQFDTHVKEPVVPPTDASQVKNKTSEEERKKIRENEINDMQERVDEISTKISELELANKKLESSIRLTSDSIEKENEKVSNIEESYRVKKCTFSLLPDADTNIEKLQGLIENSTQRLTNLASQWENHRVPLITRYRELKEALSQRQNETQMKLDEIKQMHDKIRDIGVEARHKDEMHKQLLDAYEKLTKDLNRSAYTRRITEIVSNIKKQKSEIDKVLWDTRNVQKEINRLSGKLERTFTVTDELIFRDAKKDEAVKRAYKLLAALHENCSLLIQITEETGFIIREIRELEDQVEQENQKKIVATLARITSDYKQMQQENATLMAQLK